MKLKILYIAGIIIFFINSTLIILDKYIIFARISTFILFFTALNILYYRLIKKKK
jgi:hypothetical protein